MNQTIKIRTQNKIKENQTAERHIFTMNNKRQYIVLQDVFSPQIFLGTEWLTKQLIEHCPQNSDVIQIGVGCGCTLVEMILSNKFNTVHGVDINPSAVQNTLLNLQKHNLPKANIFHSDVLSSPQLTFPISVIYWNYPFHPSTKVWDSLTYIEKSVMDPYYIHLAKMLEQAKQRKVTKIFLGFSLSMGDYDMLCQIVQSYNMKAETISKMDQQKGTICLILIQLII